MNKNDYSAKIAVNKSLLKEYFINNQRVVYLKDNQEFQIQFFNNHQFTIFASIEINGELSSNKMVCIRPGERIWLDRFLDNDNKMVFESYEVNSNSKQVKKAIKNNGLIKIYFYRERIHRPETWQNYIWYENHDNSNPTYIPIRYYSATTAPANTVNNLFTSELNLSNNYDISSIGSQVTYASLDNTIRTDGMSFSTSALSASSASTINVNSPKANASKNITGRIEHGNRSDQELHNVNTERESYWFKFEEIKLLPIENKPVTSQDLRRRYCSECGRKLNDKYKYCPFCGAKI